jgi:hypothetical protein
VATIDVLAGMGHLQLRHLILMAIVEGDRR